MIKHILLSVLLMVGLSACATFETHAPVAQLGVQVATMKVIEEHPERAGRIVEIADAALLLVDGGMESTVPLIDMAVRKQIDWQGLSPSDRLLVNALLLAVRDELQRRVGDDALDETKLLQVRQVIVWVRDAAELMV